MLKVIKCKGSTLKRVLEDARHSERAHMTKGSRKNKYKAKKTLINGVVFDSEKEAQRWLDLREQEKQGLISDLRRQVKFVVIPEHREAPTIGKRGGVKKGKIIERECAYIADFVYIKDGQKIVEDVKGYRGGGAYAVFKIKKKLMLHVWGIQIKEI